MDGSLTKLDLSRAYPFKRLNFIVVLLMSEPFTLQKAIGLELIVFGVLEASHG